MSEDTTAHRFTNYWGIYREHLFTYDSAYHGDENGDLDSPKRLPTSPRSTWRLDIQESKSTAGVGAIPHVIREVEAVHAADERVGPVMDLMMAPRVSIKPSGMRKRGAPATSIITSGTGDSRDAGISQHFHRKLRDLIDRPLLQTEHVRELEPHTDFTDAEGSDFVRTDPECDANIPGAMKIARVAEAMALTSNSTHLAPPNGTASLPVATPTTTKWRWSTRTVKTRNRPSTETTTKTLTTTPRSTMGPFLSPRAPGLGVNYDWEFIESNATGRRVYE